MSIRHHSNRHVILSINFNSLSVSVKLTCALCSIQNQLVFEGVFFQPKLLKDNACNENDREITKHMPVERHMCQPADAKRSPYANVNPALGFDVVDEHCQHQQDTSNAAPSKSF